ncbi:MAG: hypothetical protein L6Q66_03415 [Bacteroidia bacterium]|nr:hypothetical protein [Bacteroidia bacterium]
MKKQTILSIVLITIFTSKIFSQINNAGDFSYTSYYAVYEENSMKEKNKEYKIKQKTISGKASIGKTYMRFVYDTNGYVIEYSSKANRKTTFNYLKDDKKKEVSTYKKGKLVERDSFNWDSKQLLDKFYFNNKNKLTGIEHYTYDSTHIIEYVFYKMRNGKKAEADKRVFEYYPDHSYKKITYFKKGKAKRYSVFDCNPVGENHKIKNDSTYNCVKYDIDSLGNKIRVSIVNEKNLSRKNIEYFDNNDKIIARKSFDLKKNQPLYFVSYKNGDPWLLSTYISYRKGKEDYKIENKYDNNDKYTGSDYYSKGKLNSHSNTFYNEKGLISNRVNYNKKNKRSGEVVFEYLYY